MKLKNEIRILPVTACLLALAVFPDAASGAVGHGVRSPFGQAKVSTPAQNTFQGGNPNPGVHPPNSKPYGLTYGEWSAQWWQWSLKIPAATNPNLDTTGAHCAEGQSGPVWFLAGWFPGAHPSVVIRECTIPAGKSLMIPLANIASGAGLLDCDGPPPFDVPCANFVFNGKTGVDGLREEAKVAMDNPGSMEVIVDGVPLRLRKLVVQ